MHTFKLAEALSDSLTDMNPPSQLQQVTSLSSTRELCKLLRFSYAPERIANEPNLQFHHRRFKAGERVYRSGQTFESLYVVRFGFLKIVLRNSEGDERVLSFPMKGNLLGVDGIYNYRYETESTALTDCELIIIPFNRFLTATYLNQELEKIIYMSISREIVEEHTGISVSSVLKSEGRVAFFLESIANRYAERGYSSKEILLPMTRRDIGCHLGLTLETVSRALSALAAVGAIVVRRKYIQILRPELLHSFQSNSTSPRQKIRPIQALEFA